MSETSTNRRGRPRSRAARERVLAAARALLEEGGAPAVTMEAVAARAGVGKPTIYRSWPNAQAVAMAALMELAPDAEPASKRDRRRPAPALNALRAQLRSVVGVFATPAGRGAAQLIAASDGETEIAKAFRHRVILKSRTQGRTLLERAVEEGVLRADADLEAALDLIYGPIFFRLLVGHAPLDARFADAVLDTALEGLRAPKG